MTNRHIVTLGAWLALAGCNGESPAGSSTGDASADARVADAGPTWTRPDAGPAPAACTLTPAYGLGFSSAPGGAPPIIWSPMEPVDTDATVVEIALVSGTLSLRVTIAGMEQSFEVPDVAELPTLAAGDAVHVTTDARYGGLGDSTQLVVRDDAGVVAAYQRGRGHDDARSQAAWLSDAVGVDLSAEPTCRTGGGQCGRAAIAYALVSEGVRVEPGATAELGGSLALRSIVALDDGDAWYEDTVCAIGTLVAFGADVVRH